MHLYQYIFQVTVRKQEIGENLVAQEIAKQWFVRLQVLRKAFRNAYPTSGGNSVSFGVPMRRDSCTSQGLQPWLISTSDCTDMYM